MYNDFQQQVQNHTTELSNIETTALAAAFDRAALIGLGEVPHHIVQYKLFCGDAIKYLLNKGNRILVLLEVPFWLSRFLMNYLIHGDTELFSQLSHGLGFRYVWNNHMRCLLKQLRNWHHIYPQKLFIHAIDISMNSAHQLLPAFIQRRDPEKCEQSSQIMNMFRTARYDEHADQREQFLFQEALASIAAYSPGKVVILSGSFHIARQPGAPFGHTYIEPLFSRLMRSHRYRSVSCALFAIRGTYGKWFKCGQRHILAAANCAEYFMKGPKRDIRELLQNLPGSQFLTDLASLNLPPECEQQYHALQKEYDYLISFARVSAATN